jgi:hypothetical protein
MPVQFQAPLVHCSKDDWIWHVALGADQDSDDAHYLALQRGEPTQADLDAGIQDDGVYLECGDQGCSWYQ